METFSPPWGDRASWDLSLSPGTLNRCLPEACFRFCRHCFLLKTILKPNMAPDLGPSFGHVGHFLGHFCAVVLKCLQLRSSAQRFFIEFRFIFMAPGALFLLVFVGEIEDSRLCFLIALEVDLGSFLNLFWSPKPVPKSIPNGS